MRYHNISPSGCSCTESAFVDFTQCNCITHDERQRPDHTMAALWSDSQTNDTPEITTLTSRRLWSYVYGYARQYANVAQAQLCKCPDVSVFDSALPPKVSGFNVHNFFFGNKVFKLYMTISFLLIA